MIPRHGRGRRALISAFAAALLLPTLALAAPAVASGSSPSSPSGGTAATFSPPPIKHVWTIMLENKSYEAAFTGLNQNSYLWKTLPRYGLLARQYYGTSHFSQTNYLSEVSGQATSPGPQMDCPLYNEVGPVAKVADDQYKFLENTEKPDGTYHDGSPQPGCVSPAEVPTVFNQFDDAGVTYRGYMQDMGNDPAREDATCGNPAPTPGPNAVAESGAQGPYASPGSLAAPTDVIDDQYVAKHNPFPWFHSVLDTNACTEHVVPLEKNLLEDLQSAATTPAFSFITPNNCSDAHDTTCVGDNLSGGSSALTGEKKTPANTQGGLYAADLFLQEVVPAIMRSPAYQDGGLIDIHFDEGFPPYKIYGNSIADKNFTPDAGLGTVTGAADPENEGTSVESQANTAQSVVACCNELHGPNTDQPGFQAFNQDTTPGGGITGAVLISPYITPGSVSDQPYNHFSWLRSVEDVFGITTGGSDGAGHLGYAGADGLRPFGPDVYNNPTAKVLPPTASGLGGVYPAVARLSAVAEPISHDPLDEQR